jgi:hypothetical protein
VPSDLSEALQTILGTREPAIILAIAIH